MSRLTVVALVAALCLAAIAVHGGASPDTDLAAAVDEVDRQVNEYVKQTAAFRHRFAQHSTEALQPAAEPTPAPRTTTTAAAPAANTPTATATEAEGENQVDVGDEYLESDPFATDASLPQATWEAPPELTLAEATAEKNIATAVFEQHQEWIAQAKEAVAKLEEAAPQPDLVQELPPVPDNTTVTIDSANANIPIVRAVKCKGTCKATSAGCSGGTFHKGLCPGASNIQCCIANAPATVRCGGTGVCKSTSSGCSGGTFKSGLCPGSASIKCCVPNPRPSAPSAPLGPACGHGGRCKATSAGCSGGQFQSGLCPGASNIQCCLPAAPGPANGCGVYNGAPISQQKGNGGRWFGVTPIKREHLSNPGTYGQNPTTTDNTMLMSTACAFERMRVAAKSAGFTLRINSGFRSLARQQYFWNCYVTKRCNNGNLAARPGTSNHGVGIALDLAITSSSLYRWLANNAHRYGFVRTVPRENWHWEHRPGWRRASYT